MVEEVKDSSKAVRLIPFEFSILQAYVLEFGDEYIRFFANNGQVLDGGSPYEIASPWTEDDLAQLRFKQSADVVYIAHPKYRPRKLIRRGNTDWSIEVLDTNDGPYDAVQTPGWSLGFSNKTSDPKGFAYDVIAGPELSVASASAITGGIRFVTTTDHGLPDGQRVGFNNGSTGPYTVNPTITVVDSTTFDVVDPGVVYNGAIDYTTYKVRPTPFTLADGFFRKIRIKNGSTWVSGQITGVAIDGSWGQEATPSMDVVVHDDLGATATITTWRVGVWYGEEGQGFFLGSADGAGYPSCLEFHEDRFFFAGAPGYPNRVDGSRSSDYENFAPSDPDGTVASDHALAFFLNSGEVNEVQWMSSDEKGMAIGATSGEWTLRAPSQVDALSPTNLSIKPSDTFGCAAIEPVRTGKAAVFVQRAQHKVGDITYFLDVDGFRTSDISILGEHLLKDGIKSLAFQRDPTPIIWALTNTGKLLSLAYGRDADGLRAGWQEHIIAGTSDGYDSNAQVESFAVIPSPDTNRYELWLSVQRYIDGGTKRYIEYMEKVFDSTVDQVDAFFVDSGLSFEDTKDVVSITLANPAVVTVTGHGWSNGDTIQLKNVRGGLASLNNKKIVIQNKTTDTFELADTDTSALTAGFPGITASRCVSALSGLDHLEGETVAILGDGMEYTQQEVSSGAISIPSKCAVVHVGLPFNTDVQLLRPDVGSADGTSIGKLRNVNYVVTDLFRTLGLKVGLNFDRMTSFILRKGNDDVDVATPLFSGLIGQELEGNYDTEGQVCYRQSSPLPMTIRSVLPQVVTQDRG